MAIDVLLECKDYPGAAVAGRPRSAQFPSERIQSSQSEFKIALKNHTESFRQIFVNFHSLLSAFYKTKEVKP